MNPPDVPIPKYEFTLCQKSGGPFRPLVLLFLVIVFFSVDMRCDGFGRSLFFAVVKFNGCNGGGFFLSISKRLRWTVFPLRLLRDCFRLSLYSRLCF